MGELQRQSGEASPHGSEEWKRQVEERRASENNIDEVQHSRRKSPPKHSRDKKPPPEGTVLWVGEEVDQSVGHPARDGDVAHAERYISPASNQWSSTSSQLGQAVNTVAAQAQEGVSTTGEHGVVAFFERCGAGDEVIGKVRELGLHGPGLSVRMDEHIDSFLTTIGVGGGLARWLKTKWRASKVAAQKVPNSCVPWVPQIIKPPSVSHPEQTARSTRSASGQIADEDRAQEGRISHTVVASIDTKHSSRRYRLPTPPKDERACPLRFRNRGSASPDIRASEADSIVGRSAEIDPRSLLSCDEAVVVCTNPEFGGASCDEEYGFIEGWNCPWYDRSGDSGDGLGGLSRDSIVGATSIHLNPICIVAVDGAGSDSEATINAAVNLLPQAELRKKHTPEEKRARAAIKKAKKKISTRLKDILNLKTKIKELKETHQIDEGVNEGLEYQMLEFVAKTRAQIKAKFAKKKAKLEMEKFYKRYEDAKQVRESDAAAEKILMTRDNVIK